MVPWYDGPTLPGVEELLDTNGVWLGTRVCGCCGQRKVAEIRYGDGSNDRFLACQNCDRQKGKA